MANAGGGGAATTLTPNQVTINNVNSPYSVAASDSVLVCAGTSGGVTANLPAATGSHRLLILTNQSTSQTCTAHPSGTDAIDGRNANFIIQIDLLTVQLFDNAAGAWIVLQQQATYNNFGDSIYQGVDQAIAVNVPPTTPTLTAVTGTNPPAGTYQVCTTYQRSTGQTVCSTAQSITTSGGTQNIKVTSPAAKSDATGWDVYISTAGGTCPGANCHQQGSGNMTIGTDYTQTAAINTTSGTPATTSTFDTVIFSNALHTPVVNRNLDMTDVGSITLVGSGAAGVGAIKVALWNNNNGNANCVFPFQIPANTNPFNVSYNCAAFSNAGNLSPQSLQYMTAYVTTTSSGLVAKAQDLADSSGGAANATYHNMVINVTF